MVWIVHGKIYQSMPTLKEYILTLRAYNPGISDKTITVYLLKLGKKIEDIEVAFQEVSGKQPVEFIESVDPVKTTIESVQAMTQVTDLEVMPQELSSGHSASVQVDQIKESVSSRPKEEQEIHHQSFEHLVRLQDMIKDLDKHSSDSFEPSHVSATGISTDKHPVSLDISVPNTQSSMQYGSSMQRKKFSYEELFGDSNSQHISTLDDASHSLPASSPVSDTGSSLGTNSSISVPPQAPASFVSSSQMFSQYQSQSQPQSKPQPLATTQKPLVNTKVYTQSVQPVPKRRGVIKKIVLTILLLAIVFGGLFGYTRYVHGVYLFVKAPYEPELFMEQFIKHLLSIQTAEYELGINMVATESSPEDEVFRISASNPSDASLVESLDLNQSPNQSANSSTSSPTNEGVDRGLPSTFIPGSLLPTGSKITLGLKGVYQTDTSSRDNILSFTGTYVDNGITFDIDIETITNDGVLYIKVNSVPTFLFDATKMKGKWISISPKDIESVFGDMTPISAFSSSQKQSLVKVLQYFAQSGAFTVSVDPEKIITQDRKVQYVYKLTVDTERLVGFIQNLPQLLRAELGQEGELYAQLMEGIGKNLTSPEVKRYIEYVNRHSAISITVDSKGKLIGIMSQSDTVVSNNSVSESASTPQKTSTTVELKTNKINSNVTVESPTEVDMTLLDAYALFTGKSKEDILFLNQVNRVQSLDQVIMNNLRTTGTVPANISEIKQTYMGSVKDVFANPGEEFVYTTSSSTAYQFTYNINLPSVPTDYYEVLYSLTVGPEAIGDNKYDSGISSNTKKPVLTLRFVEGKNTATQSALSKEAMMTISMDADKDGLSDVLEAYLGLNPSKADTDADGKADSIEVRQGTNPKGEGSWAVGYGGQ